jgi:glycosyltransferase involved in cell wall biosynthesis
MNSTTESRPAAVARALDDAVRDPQGRDSSTPSRLEVPGEPQISVVVPLFNEAEVIDELHARLAVELRRRDAPYELVFVDDGSRDGTFERLAALFQKDSEHVRVVRLRRNFGQTAALAAGIDHARGAVIIAMDGDLQHDPADLPRFFEKIDEGYELVSGWRERRVDGFLWRRLPSRIANWLMAKLSGVPLHDFGTTYKAYRREILEGLELHGELHRFIPALLSWQGVRMAEVPIRSVPRKHGASNYGISRTFRVMFDLITVKFLVSYISRPLHVFGMAGGLLFGGGFLVAALLTCLYYLGQIVMHDHLGNLVFAMLLMMLGVQLVALGLTLEVAVRTYHAASGRRIYAVRQVLGSPQQTGCH